MACPKSHFDQNSTVGGGPASLVLISHLLQAGVLGTQGWKILGTTRLCEALT